MQIILNTTELHKAIVSYLQSKGILVDPKTIQIECYGEEFRVVARDPQNMVNVLLREVGI